MQIKLKVLSAENTLFDKNVDFVIMEAVNGSLGILPKHAPLAAILNKSSIWAHSDGQKEEILIDGGFARVLPDAVTVFI